MKTKEEILEKYAPFIRRKDLDTIKDCNVTYIPTSEKEFQLVEATGEIPLTLKRIAKWFPRIERMYQIYHQMDTLNVSYTTVKIPKRNGKFRILHTPNEELKRIQTEILYFLYYYYLVNAHCHGFVPGRSVTTNAAAHIGRDRFLKLDIYNAFPSTESALLHGLVSNEVYQVLHRLCFLKDGKGLPQGAPTSGYIFNIILDPLDDYVAEIGFRVGFRYTRYADDITISWIENSRVSIKKTIALVKEKLAELGFRLNENKIRTGKVGHVHVTGYVVHKDRITIPRKYRRIYRAMLHNHKTGKRKLSNSQINGIKGWLYTANIKHDIQSTLSFDKFKTKKT